MHRRELNHSRRFWRLVAACCPRLRDARRWLRQEGKTLVVRRRLIVGARLCCGCPRPPRHRSPSGFTGFATGFHRTLARRRYRGCRLDTRRRARDRRCERGRRRNSICRTSQQFDRASLCRERHHHVDGERGRRMEGSRRRFVRPYCRWRRGCCSARALRRRLPVRGEPNRPRARCRRRRLRAGQRTLRRARRCPLLPVFPAQRRSPAARQRGLDFWRISIGRDLLLANPLRWPLPASGTADASLRHNL